MIICFKRWFYKEDGDDWYSQPDENIMQNVLKTPTKASHMQDNYGELFIFQFPLSIQKIKIVTGGKISEKSPAGSLTAACLRYLKDKNYKDLYNLLLRIKNHSNKKISNQILFHQNENAQ